MVGVVEKNSMGGGKESHGRNYFWNLDEIYINHVEIYLNHVEIYINLVEILSFVPLVLTFSSTLLVVYLHPVLGL